MITSVSPVLPKNHVLCDCVASTFADFPPDPVTFGPMIQTQTNVTEGQTFQTSFPNEGKAVKPPQLPCHEQRPQVPTQMLQTTRFMPWPAPAWRGTQQGQRCHELSECQTQDTSPRGNQASLNLLLMQKLISLFICFLTRLDLVKLKRYMIKKARF